MFKAPVKPAKSNKELEDQQGITRPVVFKSPIKPSVEHVEHVEHDVLQMKSLKNKGFLTPVEHVERFRHIESEKPQQIPTCRTSGKTPPIYFNNTTIVNKGIKDRAVWDGVSYPKTEQYQPHPSQHKSADTETDPFIAPDIPQKRSTRSTLGGKSNNNNTLNRRTPKNGCSTGSTVEKCGCTPVETCCLHRLNEDGYRIANPGEVPDYITVFPDINDTDHSITW